MFSLSGLIPTLPQAHHSLKHKKNVEKKREHTIRVGYLYILLSFTPVEYQDIWNHLQGLLWEKIINTINTNNNKEKADL